MAFYGHGAALPGTMGAWVTVCFPIVNQNHLNKANLRLKNMLTFQRFCAFSYGTEQNPNRFRQCRTTPDHSAMKYNRHAFSHDGRPRAAQGEKQYKPFQCTVHFPPVTKALRIAPEGKKATNPGLAIFLLRRSESFV